MLYIIASVAELVGSTTKIGNTFTISLNCCEAKSRTDSRQVPSIFAESEIGVGVRVGVRLAVADGTRIAVRVRVRHAGRGLSSISKITSSVEFGESKSKVQPKKKKVA
jgi:hypothetical protein